MERKNVILLTVIAVATLLTAMVGSTFAFFTASVTRDDEVDQAFTANTAVISATYSESSEINLTNVVPGDKGSKTITINNTSGVAVDFEIAFSSYQNGFTNLQYKLEQGEGQATSVKGLTSSIEPNEEGFVTMGATNLHDNADTLVTGHLNAGESQTFTLTIQLKDTGEEQNEDDANKTFKGKLQATVNTVKPAE